ILEVLANERWSLEVLREPILQVERRHNPIETGRAEGLVDVEAIKRHAATPAGIEGLGVEDTIARADHGLRIPGVSDSQSRREAVVPGLFGEITTKARLPILIPRKSETPWTPAGSGVRPDRIEEREAIELLAEWREGVPAQSIIDR